MFKFVLISSLVAFSYAGLIGGGLMGGWKSADANDANVQKAVSFAETSLNARMNCMFASKVVNVVSAKTQLVNGVNYQIEFNFAETDCRKGDNMKDLSACMTSGKNQVCDVRVWMSFGGDMQLGDFNCGSSMVKRAGGVSSVPKSEYGNYMDTAIRAFSMSNADIKNMKLESVKTQIVSGQKIMMVVSGDMGDNAAKCEIDVWSQPWLADGFKVTKFDCKQTEKRALGGGVSAVAKEQFSNYMDTAIRAFSESNADIKNMKLESVKTQVVSGSKIMMVVSGEMDGKDARCEVDVWSQPWLADGFRVTKFKCSKTEKRAIFGGVTGGISAELDNKSVFLSTAQTALSMSNSRLTDVEVVSARTQTVAGQNIYLTVRGKESGVAKTCDITVWKRVWLTGDDAFKVTNFDCKNSNSKRSIMPIKMADNMPCAGCISGEKDPKTNEYMSLFIRAFGMDNSHNLDINNIKIKSVRTQVVAGTKYYMKVETSEAGEPRLCDVSFVVAPWMSPSMYAVNFDCKAM